ncbi:MAG: hypothetical protein IAE78_29635 [Myxococcus sp.]|nr:hypothetical protein [Myxococcus sp.]
MTKNEQHLRRIDLERLSAGEVIAGAEHLAQCPACAQAVEALRRDASAFVQRRPTATVLERVHAARTASWRRWWPALGVPLAAGLALAVFVGAPPAVRLKGATFTVLVNDAVMLSPGAPVRAGDRLSFVVEAARAGHVLVLDLEAGRPTKAFVPYDGDASVPVPAGRTVLPDAVTLDDATAREWLVCLLCEGPVSLGEVQVRQPGEGGAPVVEHPGCRVEAFDLTRSSR